MCSFILIAGVSISVILRWQRKRKSKREEEGEGEGESEAKANWLPEWHLMHTARWTAATPARTTGTDDTAIVRNMRQNICYWFGQLLVQLRLYIYLPTPHTALEEMESNRCPAWLHGCPVTQARPFVNHVIFHLGPRLNTLNVPNTHTPCTHTPYTHTHTNGYTSYL